MACVSIFKKRCFFYKNQVKSLYILSVYQKTDDSVYLEKTKRDHKQTDHSILIACANFIAYFFLITISNGEVQVNSVKEKHTSKSEVHVNRLRQSCCRDVVLYY